MALDTKGTAHIFGITAGVEAVTNATVQSFSKSKSKTNLSETVNELGNKIERRSDDVQTEVNITLKIQASYSIPEVGDLLVYNSVSYDIITVEEGETNNAHVVVTITAMVSEYISNT